MNPVLVTAALLFVTRAFGREIDRETLLLSVLAFNLVISVFSAIGVYRRRPGSSAPRLVAAWSLVVAALCIIGFATRTGEHFSRVVIGTWATVAIVVLCAVDVLIGALANRLRARARGARLAVIAGAGEVAERVAERIRNAPGASVRIAGVFDDAAPAGAHVFGARVLGRIADLAAYVKARGVDEVYVALPAASSEPTGVLLDDLRDTTASVYVVPTLCELPLPGARVDVQDMKGVPVCVVYERPFADAVRAAIKRTCDLFIAGIGLVITGPALLVIAAALKLTSRGPVIIKHLRAGPDGRELVIYKLRTTTVVNGRTVLAALGGFLRRYYLDELPQLLNVLGGTMSMVGPRPHAPQQHREYQQLLRGFTVRQKIKPGITGWAQIQTMSFGNNRERDWLHSRVELDIHYMRTWSLLFDLEILIRTPFMVVLNKSAERRLAGLAIGSGQEG